MSESILTPKGGHIIGKAIERANNLSFEFWGVPTNHEQDIAQTTFRMGYRHAMIDLLKKSWWDRLWLNI
jgi:hypothetical protein